ncbi:sirohydrochlorin chelatase [Parachitinimonas caeni]|uniref:CbiX/SirB N-terminal domain-containing protein n=1 Tax=Parachitinimonas caeni TaxID=3031301 RepID=A0ABT7DZ73_9NEIS|nr:CbiX/SirB N-terminal domain-containing protein [Parachitinimonas caeni]MDK2125360.1 CbiX/SirB N-terminal domain-containing protein [Parachitinimonas caeni]
MPHTAIVLFAHGARDPQWAQPFEQLADALRQRRPEAKVEIAYLELMQPSLANCIAALATAGISDILVVPAFMARGGHLKRDLPTLLDSIRQQHPQLHIQESPALGESPVVQAAMANWICDYAGSSHTS